MGSNATVIKDNLLIIDGKIEAFGNKAKEEALKKNIKISKSGNKILAPMLVDSHSFLEDPLTGVDDNLENLKFRAKKSGFGTIAFLPNSNNWRDNPEKIPFQKNYDFDLNIYFWGSLSLEDEGKKLSPHSELLKSGSIGLSTSNFFDNSIIFKGFSLPFTLIGFNDYSVYPQYFSVSSPISISTPAFFVADSNLAAVFTASPIAE